VAAALLGIVAVSLRTQYLPAVVGLGVLAAGVAACGGGAAHRMRLALVHTLVFAGVFFGAYALEEGVRTNTAAGFFLLMAWSSVLAQDDFPRDERLQAIVDSSRCELSFEQRDHQMWWDGCLKSRIQAAFPDDHQAEAYAGRLALRLLAHDPLAVLHIGLRNWRGVWATEPVVGRLRTERGGRQLPDDFIGLVRDNYDRDLSNWGERETLVGDWFDRMAPWYRWVALSPLLLLAWWLLTLRRLYPVNLLVAAAGLLLLVSATLPATTAMIRYYEPMAWISFIGIVGMLDVLWRLAAPPRTAMTKLR